MSDPFPASKCPHCGYLFETTTNLSDPAGSPEPGCLSMCIECQEILRFDNSLHLEKIDPMDLLRMRLDPENEKQFDVFDQAAAFFKMRKSGIRVLVGRITIRPEK